MKTHEFFMNNHDSWKIHEFLWTIMPHEKSWIFMNNHGSWKFMNFYGPPWLTFSDDFFGRLFRRTFLAENMTFHDFLATFWDHSGTIQASPRHHFKVISVTFWRLFGRNFFGHQNWSGMIGASCRSCFVSINSHEPAINSHVPAINTHVPAINSS